MTEFDVDDYADFEEFTERWDDCGLETARQLWQLLGEFTEDELLIKLPEWLAERKVGYIDGGTPTLFVGRIVEETEKAIRLADGTAARPLMSLAHRIEAIEDGLAKMGLDESRRVWLEERVESLRADFADREEMAGLREEWLPKSQILAAVRRTE